ncbi:MAG: hypothetical protein FD123_4369 [Bacteroidetes bacterium]|nr:MAG: hypothetical protein FD123_4369 [Bacteroidota bacterium]
MILRNYLYTACILCFLFSCSGNPKPIGDFSVQVESWSMFGKAITSVAGDKITVTWEEATDSFPGTHTASFPLTDIHLRDILRALGKIDCDTLQENYVNHNSLDDALEFVFRFRIDGKEKVTHIYMTKVEPVFQFTAAVNRALPDTLQIPYNEHYLLEGD